MVLKHQKGVPSLTVSISVSHFIFAVKPCYCFIPNCELVSLKSALVVEKNKDKCLEIMWLCSVRCKRGKAGRAGYAKARSDLRLV